MTLTTLHMACPEHILARPDLAMILACATPIDIEDIENKRSSFRLELLGMNIPSKPGFFEASQISFIGYDPNTTKLAYVRFEFPVNGLFDRIGMIKRSLTSFLRDESTQIEIFPDSSHIKLVSTSYPTPKLSFSSLGLLHEIQDVRCVNVEDNIEIDRETLNIAYAYNSLDVSNTIIRCDRINTCHMTKYVIMPKGCNFIQ